MRMEDLKYLSPKFKFIFLLGVSSLCIYSCYTVERDCERFHTGIFEFSSVINGEIKTSYFTRSANLEIETFEGKIDSSSIRWVNSCECILTKLKPKSNQDKRPVQIKILSTKNDTYNFEYSLVGRSENKQRGKVKKIN